MSQFNPTPPMYGEPELAEERPSWPMVLGIFSIVWGTLAVLCGGCTSAWVAGQNGIMNWLAQVQAQAGPQPGGGPTLPSTQMPAELSANAAQIGGALLGVVGGIVLLVAGILLVRRRPSARMAHFGYAVISLLSTVIGLVGALNYAASFEAFSKANPDNDWVKFLSTSSSPGSQIAMAIGGTVVSVIFPIFVLIWFGLVKKRPEDMGGAAADVYV